MFTANAPIQLTVQSAGTGAGTITSSPAGINCGPTCSASFASGTAVTLTAAANANSTFAGWSGACTGTGTCSVTLTSATSVTATFTANAPPPPPTFQLTVVDAGTGSGTVTSSPAGINCGATCSASFNSGAAVTLTAAPNGSATFDGWSGGGCSGTGTCSVTLASNTSVTATFTAPQSLSSLNHIIFLAQENRSFDHYFGSLRDYWKRNGYPDQSFDGLPQFNPTSGAAPLQGPIPSNPGCDPTAPLPSDCVYDTNNPISSFHMITQCAENTSPSWNESHVIWNFNDQVGKYPAKLNGFVWVAAHDGRSVVPTFTDADGIRAMGYYNDTDLPYYYFMASNFATSDRWFHPVMTRTHPNREFLIAATSQGRVYPNGTNAQDSGFLTAKTIFEELQDAGITWKIYVDPAGSTCKAPYTPACLMGLSYLHEFAYSQTVLAQFPQNIASLDQYHTDLANGTLPQVAQIEPNTQGGFDEHPATSDAFPTDIQYGANYVATQLINPLMQSPSWKDSAFILTYDEYGALYDHVPAQPAVSPDGIKPVDLQPNDVCTNISGPICDFTYTGYRVPLIVISPFTKKNYVSHTVTDFTAILKLIETRFNVPALTKRDAAQMDMTEFFDFTNPPWTTPPSPPRQPTNGACYMTHLP
jgi:phospholipase C